MKFSEITLLMMPGGEGSGWESMIFMLAIFAAFWFFMIRPQVKKQKDQQKFKDSVQKGDKVVTIGGIHGKILELNDTTMVIEVEGGNRLKVEKSAISMESTAALNKAAGK